MALRVWIMAILCLGILAVACETAEPTATVERCIEADGIYHEAWGAETCPIESLLAMRFLDQRCPMVEHGRLFIKGSSLNPCDKYRPEPPCPSDAGVIEEPSHGFGFIDRECE